MFEMYQCSLLNRRWLLNANPKKYIPKMAALNFNDHWRLQESIEDIALYVKNPSRQKTDRLIERSFNPFPVTNAHPWTFDNTITLIGIKSPENFPQKYRIFPVTMYWKCLRKTNTPYRVFINIISADGVHYYSKRRVIGSMIYPMVLWRKDEYIKESYFYLLPRMPQGKFIIDISIYNPVRRKLVVELESNFIVSI